MKKIFIAIVAFAALLFVTSCAQQTAPAEKFDTAVQLYNFRTMINTPEGYAANHEDIFNTLAEQGYTDVEAAGYRDGLFYGVTPEQFKADVEAAGLRVLSSHTSMFPTPDELKSGDFTENLAWWDKCIADHVTAGMKYIVWPFMRMPETLPELQNFCNLLNEVGKKCAEAGISFGYHSHWMEYDKVEDQVAMDYMIQNTDPNYVFFQMDVYWAVIGKVSPVEYFNKYPGRFHMLHIKDHYNIGASGMVGYDAIFRNAEVAGVENIVVEEEAFPIDDWKACMQENIDYLQWVRNAVK